jgi:hypothetical protein
MNAADRAPELIDIEPAAFVKAAPAGEDSRDTVARYLAALAEIPDDVAAAMEFDANGYPILNGTEA